MLSDYVPHLESTDTIADEAQRSWQQPFSALATLYHSLILLSTSLLTLLHYYSISSLRTCGNSPQQARLRGPRAGAPSPSFPILTYPILSRPSLDLIAKCALCSTGCHLALCSVVTMALAHHLLFLSHPSSCHTAPPPHPPLTPLFFFLLLLLPRPSCSLLDLQMLLSSRDNKDLLVVSFSDVRRYFHPSHPSHLPHVS